LFSHLSSLSYSLSPSLLYTHIPQNTTTTTTTTTRKLGTPRRNLKTEKRIPRKNKRRKEVKKELALENLYAWILKMMIA